MWEKLKALPMAVKVIIGFFVAIFGFSVVMTVIGLVILALHHGPDPQPPQNQEEQVVYPSGYNPQREVNPATTNNGGGREGQLANYEAQMAKLQATIAACQNQEQQFQQQMQQSVMSGGSYGIPSEPPCRQYSGQWVSQSAILQTYIARLKTGNMNLTVCQVDPALQTCGSIQLASGAGSSSSGGGSGDSGRYSRQAIRGNTIYTDEEGGTHELPTAPYYFKDKQTGEFVSSQYPTPPNNTHTYESMTPEN
jgi:hypothetical protein